MEYRGVNYISPEWQMMDQFFLDIVTPALDLDSLTTSHPVSVEVKDPKVMLVKASNQHESKNLLYQVPRPL